MGELRDVVSVELKLFIVALFVVIQLLISVIVTEYVPEERLFRSSVVSLLLHIYEYVPVPPLTLRLIIPSFDPQFVISKALMLEFN